MAQKITPAARRNRALGVCIAVALTGGLSACSSTSSLPPAPGDGASAKAGTLTQAQVVDAAPVAPASAITPGSWADKIRTRGVLQVGGSDSTALWSQRNPVSGDLEGFDAGLAQMLAKYITGKPTVKLSQTTVDTREALLQNGTVDTVFATYTITPKRAEKVNFAGPYYLSGDAILVPSSNTSITKPSDLNGKTVATEGNSPAAVDVKKEAPDAKVLLFQEDGECLAAVKQGRADAYVLDQGILLGDAVKDPQVKVVGEPFNPEPYGIGLPKDPDAKAFVNAWLKQIFADGSWAKMWKATLGTKLSGDAPAAPAIGSADGS